MQLNFKLNEGPVARQLFALDKWIVAGKESFSKLFPGIFVS